MYLYTHTYTHAEREAGRKYTKEIIEFTFELWAYNLTFIFFDIVYVYYKKCITFISRK